MNEDFVTFEIAKKLEDKSFDWDASEMFERNIMACRYADFRKPSIYQALKWLREEKKMHVTVLFITDCSNDADNNICEEWSFWSFSVINLNDGSNCHDDFETIDCVEYQSYEQAALAGIEYVLDNLI